MSKGITPDGVKQIGRAIGGTHWQADVARGIDYSKSMITRVLNSSRTPDEHFTNGLRNMMVEKIEGLNDLFTMTGLPGYANPKTKKAQKMIADAVKLLREVE